jgi:hypothetical protein
MAALLSKEHMFCTSWKAVTRQAEQVESAETCSRMGFCCSSRPNRTGHRHEQAAPTWPTAPTKPTSSSLPRRSPPTPKPRRPASLRAPLVRFLTRSPRWRCAAATRTHQPAARASPTRSPARSRTAPTARTSPSTRTPPSSASQASGSWSSPA